MAELVFGSVASAIKWAEEWAIRPDVKSQLGGLCQVSRGSSLSRSEIKDIANTITAIVAGCEPPTGTALQCVYVGFSIARDYTVAEAMAEYLASWQKPYDRCRRKSGRQLQALSYNVIKALRANELYHAEYPSTRIAAAVGVRWDTYYRSAMWPKLQSEAHSVLNLWVDRAEKETALALQQRGWLA